jgi:hypothetical protein
MKLLPIAALALFFVVATQAQQGAVTFGNSGGTAIRAYGTNVNATVALYGSTNLGLLNDSTLTQIGATVNTFAPGIFAGGTRFIGNPNDIVTLQVRAWTGGYATWDLAQAAALANPSVEISVYRPMWQQLVGGGTNPTQPITGAGRFQGLTLGIPEPSGIALALLGTAFIGLGFWRRD